MKNNEKLIEAIGGIDGSMINSAFERKTEKKSRAGLIEAIGCVAAVAALAVFAVVLSHYARKDDNVSSPPSETVEGKSVQESDYNKFDTSYYSYEEGDYRFDLTTYTPKDEHFFFECELAISNMSDHDISIYKLGEYGSFFDLVCNFTRGDYHQILHYRGTADKNKTKITLAPGQSYSENLTLITQVSEKLTKTYIQAPHNVEVRSSVTVYPYEQKSGLFLFDIMRIQGTEYVKDAGKSGIVLTDISAVREIPGGWGYVSAAEDESYSYAEIKLSRLLKSASVAYLLPSLIPEGYVVTHTDMTGSIYSPEEAQSLSLKLIDNVNNVVREERDEDGRVILNTDKYNFIFISLYKKSFWENSDYCNHLKKNWFIEQDLSEYSIGRKYFPEDKEYTFLIDIGEYYVLYEFKEAEGGERDLGTSDIYRIVASTPYIKDNGYKESETPFDPVSTVPISLHGVGEVRQASFIIGSEGEVSTDYNGTAFSGGLDMSTIYGSDKLRRYFPSLLPESYLVFGVATTTEDGEISRVVLKLLDDTDGSYRDGMSEAEVFSLASTHDSMYVELYKKNDANMRSLEGYIEKWNVTETLSASGIEAKYEDFYKTINCLVDFGNVIMYYHVQERGVHGATVDSDALYRIITSTPAIDAVE